MSLDEQSKEARTCQSEYDKVRRTVLRLYPWAFAAERVMLAPDPVPPAFEYEYKFALPSDYLRITDLYDYDGEWKVEGAWLLCNIDSVSLKYIRNLEDFTNVDALFIDCFEWYLAYELARYLTESETVREEALRGFKNLMPMAKFVQSTEGSQLSFDSYDLLEARRGSRFVRDPGTN
jgi:hypothetical protein